MAAIKDPENTLIIETSKGTVTIELRPDLAPKHVERIKLLAREKFYDGIPFHRGLSGGTWHRTVEASQPAGGVQRRTARARRVFDGPIIDA